MHAGLRRRWKAGAFEPEEKDMSRRKLQIRWLLAEDFPALARLDFEQAPDPWNENIYHEFLQARNQIVQVAVLDEDLVGALACRLESTTLHVERLLVAPGDYSDVTRELLVVAIRNKLNRTRSCAEILVHECHHSELVALHLHGFDAVSVVRDHFGGKRDGILMRHALFRQNDAAFLPQNRLKEYFAQEER
jgi:hypothetical protein